MEEDYRELQENAEHGAERANIAPATITMAVLEVLVAATALIGHRAHTEEILHQTRATDQWALPGEGHSPQELRVVPCRIRSKCKRSK